MTTGYFLFLGAQPSFHFDLYYRQLMSSFVKSNQAQFLKLLAIIHNLTSFQHQSRRKMGFTLLELYLMWLMALAAYGIHLFPSQDFLRCFPWRAHTCNFLNILVKIDYFCVQLFDLEILVASHVGKEHVCICACPCTQHLFIAACKQANQHL